MSNSKVNNVTDCLNIFRGVEGYPKVLAYIRSG